jgi:hypothetical protein
MTFLQAVGDNTLPDGNYQLDVPVFFKNAKIVGVKVTRGVRTFVSADGRIIAGASVKGVGVDETTMTPVPVYIHADDVVGAEHYKCEIEGNEVFVSFYDVEDTKTNYPPPADAREVMATAIQLFASKPEWYLNRSKYISVETPGALKDAASTSITTAMVAFLMGYRGADWFTGTGGFREGSDGNGAPLPALDVALVSTKAQLPLLQGERLIAMTPSKGKGYRSVTTYSQLRKLIRKGLQASSSVQSSGSASSPRLSATRKKKKPTESKVSQAQKPKQKQKQKQPKQQKALTKPPVKALPREVRFCTKRGGKGTQVSAAAKNRGMPNGNFISASSINDVREAFLARMYGHDAEVVGTTADEVMQNDYYSELYFTADSSDATVVLLSPAMFVAYYFKVTGDGYWNFQGTSSLDTLLTDADHVVESSPLGKAFTLTNLTAVQDRSSSVFVGFVLRVPDFAGITETSSLAEFKRKCKAAFVFDGADIPPGKMFAPVVREMWASTDVLQGATDKTTPGLVRDITYTFDADSGTKHDLTAAVFTDYVLLYTFARDVDSHDYPFSTLDPDFPITLGDLELDLSVNINLGSVTAARTLLLILYVPSMVAGSVTWTSVVLGTYNAPSDAGTYYPIAYTGHIDLRSILAAMNVQGTIGPPSLLISSYPTAHTALTLWGAQNGLTNKLSCRATLGNYEEIMSNNVALVFNADAAPDSYQLSVWGSFLYRPTDATLRLLNGGTKDKLTRVGNMHLEDLADAALDKLPQVMTGSIEPAAGTIGAFSLGDMISGAWDTVKNVGSMAANKALEAAVTAMI